MGNDYVVSDFYIKTLHPGGPPFDATLNGNRIRVAKDPPRHRAYLELEWEGDGLPKDIATLIDMFKRR
jgi:hypothetical protein